MGSRISTGNGVPLGPGQPCVGASEEPARAVLLALARSAHSCPWFYYKLNKKIYSFCINYDVTCILKLTRKGRLAKDQSKLHSKISLTTDRRSTNPIEICKLWLLHVGFRTIFTCSRHQSLIFRKESARKVIQKLNQRKSQQSSSAESPQVTNHFLIMKPFNTEGSAPSRRGQPRGQRRRRWPNKSQMDSGSFDAECSG